MSDEPLAIKTDEHTGRTGMQIVATLLGGVPSWPGFCGPSLSTRA